MEHLQKQLNQLQSSLSKTMVADRIAFQRRRGNVQVIQLWSRFLLFEDLLDDAASQHSRLVELSVLVIFQRYCNTRDTEERTFDRRRPRAGIEHVDARVQAAVDAADDEVRPLRAEFKDAQLDAIRRTSFDGPAATAVAVVNLFAN